MREKVFSKQNSTASSGHLRRAEALANALDSLIALPGTRKTIGLDGIIGLVPGVGDGLSSMVSLYIVLLARADGVPKIALVRMLLNIIIDTLIGAIPLMGDLADFFWKANIRNVEIWRNNQGRRKADKKDIFFIALFAIIIFGLLAFMAYLSIILFAFIWQSSRSYLNF